MPSQKSSLIIKFAIVLLVLVVLAAGAKFTIFAPYEVNGSSMVETLKDNDMIFVNKWDGSFVRGDVVVFASPASAPRSDIKRIVGLPGETVVIKDGKVFLRADNKDTELDEPYLTKAQGQTYRYPPGSGDTSAAIYVIPADSYFLLGDNRMGSLDSRWFAEEEAGAGFVTSKDIIGTVWFQ
jgi:signal peptidase I